MGIGGGAPRRRGLGGHRRRFLSFGRWEDKRTAMGYKKDFHGPWVPGDLLLPWRGKGGTLEFRELAAKQVLAGVQFASKRLGGGRGKRGADLDSDVRVPAKDQPSLRANGPRSQSLRAGVRGAATGSDSAGLAGSSCSNDGTPSELPPPPLHERDTIKRHPGVGGGGCAPSSKGSCTGLMHKSEVE